MMFAVLSVIRKPFTRLFVVFAAFWLAACQPVSMTNTGGARTTSGAPIAVALLVPHGSASPQEQQLARDLENAARLAVSDLAGVKIDLRVYGTAGQPVQAQSAALNAVADGARIIVGPLHAESANAVAVAVANKNVNVLAFSNNPTIAGGNLFILGQTFQTTANRLASFATRQGKSRIMAVYSNNLAGQLGRAAIEQAVRDNGATLAGSIGYEFSQQGVVSAIPAIRTAAETNAADAIFMTANTAGALPLFSQMLPESGLGPDRMQYIGLARWDTPRQTLDLPGVQGGWFALPDPQRTAQFNSRFQAANGNTPHPIAGLAYDGIAAVGALVKSNKREALGRNALTQSAGFQGVNGVFRLRADGSNERGLAVATIRNKQVVILSPAPQSFGGAGF
ncbi:amino acid/amide ABC transporter substrate-binding protein, HAAT family [Roseovarius lutimaris]|uniref:Amino acid/amide ABC transporter substrate-binding protein, HAAT family n=2 Tax=Roseovarius lutimaris TaxID=1005928 RepID=A0A1I5FHM9_9RHOB|nr:amino acid/amide ABC transporter substrate-binding protein, HAAT family [Roseovarius lutimaris]